ncbi:hypothetical protein GCM10023148_29680 [Actinokineospora soli]
MSETFSDVLSREIERSGYTLERLHRRLAARGVLIGVSTLSYWRRGICQPERAESLRAVGILESELELSGGTLIGLIGPPRPRGRWLSRRQVREPDALWQDARGIGAALADLGGPAPWDLDHLRVHDHHRLDRAGRGATTDVRLLVRAETTGVRSCVVVHQADPADRAAPAVTPGPECAVGRVRVHPDSRFTAAELLLDRTLSEGDTAVLSYTVSWYGREPVARYRRVMPRPPREYLLQVGFDPRARPTRCHAFAQGGAWDAERSRGALRIGGFAGVHHLFRDAEPIMGVRWRW